MFDFDELDEMADEYGDGESSAPSIAEQSLKPPRQAATIMGHDNIEQDFIQAIQSGHLPHAMIFSGLRGIGKATMAYRLARYILDSDNKNDALSADGGLFGDEQTKADEIQLAHPMDMSVDKAVFRQVASGGHPDLITVEREYDEKKQKFKADVNVDNARRLIPFMRMTASNAHGWRVAIIDDADTMNRNAQNAILKVLEEPPSNALVILVAHRVGAFLPTIRSRCRMVPFTALSKENFSILLRKQNASLPQADIDILYEMTNGSVGQALEIIEEGGLEIVQKLLGLLYDWPDLPWTQIHQLADNMGRNGQDDQLKSFRDIFMWLIASLMRAKATQSDPPQILDTDFTRAMIEKFSLDQWTQMTDDLQSHFNQVEKAYLDKRHHILGAFSIINIKENT
jgi:DNA polymerase-3 subunit delta'